MKATLSPTPEMYVPVINGSPVPTRVWRGTTEGGVPIEAYVLAIVPDPADDETHARLRAELPEFMRPARETFHIEVGDDDGGPPL
jgi:hypothetical protein